MEKIQEIKAKVTFLHIDAVKVELAIDEFIKDAGDVDVTEYRAQCKVYGGQAYALSNILYMIQSHQDITIEELRKNTMDLLEKANKTKGEIIEKILFSKKDPGCEWHHYQRCFFAGQVKGYDIVVRMIDSIK